MKPDFVFPCKECDEPIAYAGGRPQPHQCYEEIED